MEKQHNRGQDGAGVASVKLNTEPGYPFLHRLRSCANQPIADIFSQIGKEIAEIEKYQPKNDYSQEFNCSVGNKQPFGSKHFLHFYDSRTSLSTIS